MTHYLTAEPRTVAKALAEMAADRKADPEIARRLDVMRNHWCRGDTPIAGKGTGS